MTDDRSASALEQERDFLVDALRSLESDHANGDMTADEYRALSDQQTVRLAEILRRLQESRTGANATASGAAEAPTERASRLAANKRLWLVGVAAFVALSTFALSAGVGDRLFGESGTGSIAADTNTLLRRAQEQSGQGNALEALKTYDAVLERDPQNVQALTYRGWLIRLAGVPGRALESIDKAIAIDPTYPDAHFFKGFILFRDRQDPQAAIPEFETFLANDPPDAMVSLVEQTLADARAQVAQRPVSGG